MILWIFLFISLRAGADQVSEGAYLVKIAGCADCHSPEADYPFSGRLKLTTPFGVFYTPNITPDKETGLGIWSAEEFRKALRDGIAPNGDRYYPVFPYTSYTKITDEDLNKMWMYLRSVRAIARKNRRHQISFPYNQRSLLAVWQGAFFEKGPMTNNPEKTAEWNRGSYLANALAHCTECHTPRNEYTGALIASKWMSGSNKPINGLMVPNITRDKVSGRGHWTERDWEQFLLTGRNPQGRFAEAEMAQVINNTSALTTEDRYALIQYLMSLPAIRTGNDVP